MHFSLEDDVFYSNNESNEQFFMELLENGDESQFFQNWYRIFPTVSKNEPEFQRLTFYAHLYFVVRMLKLSPQQDISDLKEMKLFKKFLWHSGSYFSSDAEFVPYFVLPFVQEPHKNPTFSNLFDDSWECDLKVNLRDFLSKNYSSQNYETAGSTNDIKILANETYDIQYWKMRYDRLNRQFRRLHEDTELIIGVMFELIIAFEKSVLGEKIDLSTVLSNCYKTCPNLFNNTTKDDNILSHKITRYEDEIIEISSRDSFSVRCLDVEKIKVDLLNGSTKTKLLILQALRWGVTKTCSNEYYCTIWFITQHDVLHLSTDNKHFLKDMIMPSSLTMPNPSQQTIARLLAALTTHTMGFNYVASPDIVELLVTVVCNIEFIETDKITADLLLSILQRLSWVYYLGELMIKRNLLQWLVKKLLQSTEWNFCLRECLLLLISITRNRSAKEICVNLSNDILRFLTKFLSGSYKFAENCENIFWKYCADLENVLSRTNFSIEDWQIMSLKFSSINADILYNFLRRRDNEEDQDFKIKIDGDDPLNVKPNGFEFLRLHYNLS